MNKTLSVYIHLYLKNRGKQRQGVMRKDLRVRKNKIESMSSVVIKGQIDSCTPSRVQFLLYDFPD